MKKFILVLVLSIFALQAFANGSSGWRNLKNIKVEGTMGTFIIPDIPFSNPDDCGRTDIAIIKFSDPAKDDKVALALAAYMGGKKVNSWFAGCASSPWGDTVPVMYNIQIGD